MKLRRQIEIAIHHLEPLSGKTFDHDRPSASHKNRREICVRTCGWHVRVLWLIRGQGDDRLRPRSRLEILDTWNEANLTRTASTVELTPSADFQNYYSTTSAATPCLFSSRCWCHVSPIFRRRRVSLILRSSSPRSAALLLDFYAFSSFLSVSS